MKDSITSLTVRKTDFVIEFKKLGKFVIDQDKLSKFQLLNKNVVGQEFDYIFITKILFSK